MHAYCTSDFSGLEFEERLDAVGCRRESSEAAWDSATHKCILQVREKAARKASEIWGCTVIHNLSSVCVNPEKIATWIVHRLPVPGRRMGRKRGVNARCRAGTRNKQSAHRAYKDQAYFERPSFSLISIGGREYALRRTIHSSRVCFGVVPRITSTTSELSLKERHSYPSVISNARGELTMRH